MAGVVLILVLIASFFTVDWEGRHLVPRGFGRHAHPTSQLVLPVAPDATLVVPLAV